MLFWLCAIGIVVLVLGYIAFCVMRADPSATQAAELSHDLGVYRDQLKDVERDLARGVLSEELAEAARLEIKRRILATDKAQSENGVKDASPQNTRVMMGCVAVVTLGASFWLYNELGAPGYQDLPLEGRLDAIAKMCAERPTQEAAELRVGDAQSREAEADPSYLTLVQKLRDVMKARPDAVEGFMRLAAAESGLGNFAQAARAQSRLVELKGEQATAADFRDLAEMMILAADGYVSPEAETALAQALQRDATDPAARYYSGLMFAQTGRPDRAFRLWRTLLEESGPDDPWVPPIEAQIERAAASAGIPFELPGSREAMAEGMSADERAEMIEGMVAGLAARLADQGGPPEEWARLVRAYGVLGQTENAQAVWDEAKTVFASAPDGLALVETEATAIGLAP